MPSEVVPNMCQNYIKAAFLDVEMLRILCYPNLIIDD